ATPRGRHTVMRRRASAVMAGIAVLAAVGAGVVTALPAYAATGCRVTYAVSSQWPGGFGANVTVTNLGDPVSSWRLTWTFTAGQSITQASHDGVTPPGGAV